MMFIRAVKPLSFIPAFLLSSSLNAPSAASGSAVCGAATEAVGSLQRGREKRGWCPGGSAGLAAHVNETSHRRSGIGGQPVRVESHRRGAPSSRPDPFHQPSRLFFFFFLTESGHPLPSSCSPSVLLLSSPAL